MQKFKASAPQHSQSSFVCQHCLRKIPLVAPGTRNRNHCPFCLYSLHVDVETGDRQAVCKGLMPAVGKLYKPDGEEVLVHKCAKCSLVRKNRIAGDDSFELVGALPIVKITDC